MKLVKAHVVAGFGVYDQEGLPDYWGIETPDIALSCRFLLLDQEGLPDYWGIETRTSQITMRAYRGCIRKDYPTTGVLKLVDSTPGGVATARHQEGLPDYWGIETILYHVGDSDFLKIRKDYPTTGVLKL